MPLTRDQLQEIKTILKTSIKEIINDAEFKSLLLDSFNDIIEQKLQEQQKQYEKQIKVLEGKIDTMEQFSRRQNIRVYGIPENADIAVEEQVQNTIEKLNIKRKKIVECYRIGKINGNSRNKPRPIFVQFDNYEDKQEIISNRKKLKGTKINIKEDLTKTRLQIMMKASERYGFKNVWSQNGKIFYLENGIKREIKCSEEV